MIANQHSVFWAEPIQRWVMIYGGRLPFVELTPANPQSVLPSLSAAQVFDPTAGIYVRTAPAPQGPWSAPRTIFNPFQGTFGYCNIMYFSDAFGFLFRNHPSFFPSIDAECPTEGATRTAQKWWQSLTPPPAPNNPLDRRKIFGAEYGAAVLPRSIEAAGRGVRFQWLLSTWNPYRVVVMDTVLEQ